MNKILEQTIAWIAPHNCISCGFSGSLLCEGCRVLLKSATSRCYKCQKITSQYRTCASCRCRLRISHVWIAAEYDDLAKKIMYKIKFDRAKDGCNTIAEIISDVLPMLPEEMLVSHIPTANHRVRARGYDQAELIARRLARLKNLKYRKLFYRLGKTRQVGASRKERFAHLEKALILRPKTDIRQRRILLVDDVTTTGATIETASRILKSSGAKTVDIAVFAQP